MTMLEALRSLRGRPPLCAVARAPRVSQQEGLALAKGATLTTAEYVSVAKRDDAWCVASPDVPPLPAAPALEGHWEVFQTLVAVDPSSDTAP